MKQSLRTLFTVVMVAAMLLASVTPAFAEDPAPPPPAQNPDGSTSSGGTSGASGAAAEENAATASGTGGEDASAAEDFTRMPNYSPEGAATSGQGVFQGELLLNTSGNPVEEGTDLASQSVSYVMICSGSTVPVWYVGGTCAGVWLVNLFSNLQDAVNAAAPGQVIWAEPYFWDGNDVYINKSLTIQGDPTAPMFIGGNAFGYWEGAYVQASGVTIKDAFLYGNVNSFNWGGTLRLQNLYIQSPNYFALYIDNYVGSVILSNVYAEWSNYGSMIDVTGPTGTSTGTVTIFNSTFSHTQEDNGLEVYANNTVKLENVSSSDNWGDGAYIAYAKGLSVKNSIFNRNYDSAHPAPPANPANLWGYGLYLEDYGITPSNLLLNNVTAEGNDEVGVYSWAAGATTVTNSEFVGNYTHGLSLDGVHSTVKLDGVTSKYNRWSGLYIWAQGAVTVSNSDFNYNWEDGLSVDTSGAITLKTVTALSNKKLGADLFNAFPGVTSAVNVLGSFFANNYYEGLRVHSRGSVLLNGITSFVNNLVDYSDPLMPASVVIDNCLLVSFTCTGGGNVTVSNTMGANNISLNYAGGLYVQTRGNFTATGLNANDNLFTGMFLDGQYGVGNVTITNSTFNQNGRFYDPPAPDADGLIALSRGTISLDKVSAFSNSANGITLMNNMSLTSKTVTVKNTNTTDNYGAGLMILARGAVTINHLTSIFSHGSYGLFIDNWYSSVNPITIQNTLGNNVVNNNVTGVYLASYGNISVTGLSAKFNINYGAYIDNTFTNGSTRGTVSIKDSQFSENDAYGLQVLSRNSITLNNVKANGNNGEYGALLDNQLEAGRAVAVNKSNFDGNYTYGLSIQGGGTVTLNNVSASDNMFDAGLYIDNTYQGAYNVSILSTYGANQFNNNGFVGAWIYTAGNINISKASANNNANTGFIIYNYGTGKSLTMTCSLADGNLWGLAVYNYGSAYPVYLKGTSFIGNAINDTWSSGTGATLLYFTRVNCP